MADHSTAATVTETDVCVLPWCNVTHIYNRDYRGHVSAGIEGGHGLYARITWDEPLTTAAKSVDRGAEIFLQVNDASMRFPVRGAAELAELLREAGGEDASVFLCRVIAVAAGEGGGERRG